MGKRKGLAILVLMLLFSMLLAGRADAHAMLLEASPQPNAQLESAPHEIRLTFSERLEQGLYRLQLFDSGGQPVAAGPAQLSASRDQLVLPLPDGVPDGRYTVSYHIVSMDGHPVASAYVVTVGAAAGGEGAGAQGGALMAGGVGGDVLRDAQLGARIGYYAALLLLAGWVIWNAFVPSDSADMMSVRKRWLMKLQVGFAAFATASAVLLLAQLRGQFGWKDALASFLMTGSGAVWTASLLLAFAGFFVLPRFRRAGLLWAALVLLAESMNGHAAAAGSLRVVLADGVHLLAAAVWSGGLLHVMVHRRQFKEHTRRFLPLFSKAALAGIVVLIGTGAGLTVAFAPGLAAVLHSAWGKWLLAKVACVALVIGTGACIRRKLRTGGERTGLLLKLDFTLMALIIGIVGVFSALNPKPVNQPLHWAETGDRAGIAATVTPNAPGKNEIEINVAVPDGGEKPKQVTVLLRCTDRSDVAPVQMPLAPRESAAVSGEAGNAGDVAGLTKYAFANDSFFLPFPGKWELEIRVMDTNDDETVYRKVQTVY